GVRLYRGCARRPAVGVDPARGRSRAGERAPGGRASGRAMNRLRAEWTSVCSVGRGPETELGAPEPFPNPSTPSSWVRVRPAAWPPCSSPDRAEGVGARDGSHARRPPHLRIARDQSRSPLLPSLRQRAAKLPVAREVAELIGRSGTTQRAGYRNLEHAGGTIELATPKIRPGTRGPDRSAYLDFARK